jgi:hypothetical protein
MWPDIRRFISAIAKHSGLVVGGSIMALVSFLWTLYEYLQFGPSVRAFLASFLALALILTAAFLAWKEERDLRLAAQDVFGWRTLAEEFSAFDEPLIEAEWREDKNTKVRDWGIPLSTQNRKTEMCWEFCKIAGKRLLVSKYASSHFPMLVKNADDIDRWLNGLVEIVKAGRIIGASTSTIRESTKDYEHGRIRNLGEVSRLLCLKLASEDVSFLAESWPK